MAAGRIKGITIEIGGDSTKLVQALSSVDNAIKKTQTNLRDIDKALKFDPANVNLLKDKQAELAAEIKQTTEKIKTEQEALDQMKKTEGFDANSEAARNLKTQIDLDTAALKELEAQAKQCSSVLGTQMQVAGEKIQAVGNKIQEIGRGLTNLGQDLTTKVTVPIATVFGTAVKTTMDFDTAMSKVQATSGATADEVQQLSAKAREMGETTQFSATESAEALNYMAMAGWKTEQMIGGIDGVMHLAAASGEDLATTSDIVTDALTAFGMEAEESGRFADILASAASNANTNVAMMGESFKYVAPVAGALGYSAEDVAIALGLMANSGIKADMAGTSLRNMFQRMAKPTKESQAAMDRLGVSLADDSGKMYSFREIMDQLRVSFENINMSVEEYDGQLDQLDADLASGAITQKQYNAELEELNRQAFGAEGAEKARAAAMLGGTRAMSGLLAIANATEEDYQKLTQAIDNSSDSFAKLADGSVVPLNEALQSGQEIIEQYSGAAEAMSAIRLDNLGGDITKLKSQLEGLAISFGQLLVPYIQGAIAKISEFITWLQSLDEAQKTQIIKIAAIAAAIGPALLVIGKLVTSVSSIVTVVGKAVTGIGGLMTSLGGLEGVLAALTGPVGIVVAAIAALAAGFVYLYKTNEDFRNGVLTLVDTLKQNFANAVEAIQPALATVGEAFNGLLKVLEPAFEQIFNLVMGLISGITSAIEPIVGVVTNVINIILSTITFFLDVIQGDWEGAWNAVKSILDNALAAISNLIDAAVEFWKGFFSAFGIDIEQLFKTVWEAIKTVVRTVSDAISSTIKEKWNDIKSWISNTLSSIHNTFREIFERIRTAVAEKIDGVRNAISNGMENAISYLSSLPSRFYEWGSDMINNLIDGIRSKIDDVRQQASELAEAIADFIHFSEPDKGPLSNFHTFMPDMINELVRGIDNGIPKIQNAMGDLSGAMSDQLQGSLSVSGSGVANNNVFNINIYGTQNQTAQELVEIIEQRITENAIRRGVAMG